MIMGLCRKCGGFVCLCGFMATLSVSVANGGNPPPPRVVGPIVAQLATSTMTTTRTWVATVDEITGKQYSTVYDEQRERAQAYDLTASALDAVSTPPLRFAIKDA